MLTECYPYYITIRNKTLILIWYWNEKKESVFYKSECNLFIDTDKGQIEKKLEEINFKMAWDEPNVTIDLDTFSGSVAKFNVLI